MPVEAESASKTPHKIKLIVYDFDGVLTDNRVYVSETGQEMVACNRSDGWWMGQLKLRTIDQMILSTEKNPVVSMRAKKLGLNCLQACENKAQALKQILVDKGITGDEVAYLGNDMNDFECARIVKYFFAPQDSHPNILKMAHTVFPVNGGAGIVRHLYDLLESKNLLP